jgi:hypothetical protein
LAVETLADSELELFERVAHLEADLAAVRCILHEAVHELAHVTAQRDRLGRQHKALREQLRVLVGAVREYVDAYQRRRAG